LYTSGSENRARRELLKDARTSLLASLFLALFGAVYEAFSFSVYSYFMLYAFFPVLALLTLPALLLGLSRRGFLPARRGRGLWKAGAAALSAGSVFQGVVEIYGTSSDLAFVYPLAGGLLLLAGFILMIACRKGEARRGE